MIATHSIVIANSHTVIGFWEIKRLTVIIDRTRGVQKMRFLYSRLIICLNLQTRLK